MECRPARSSRRFKQTRESEIDLLADDRPQQAIENRRSAADPKLGPPCDEPRQSELVGESCKRRCVLVESQPAHHNIVSLNPGRRIGGGFSF